MAIESPDPVPRNSVAQRRAMIGLACALIAAGVFVSLSFIPALLWALVLAVALRPIYRRAEYRWPAARGGALLPAVFTGVVALLVLVPLAFAITQAVSEFHNLVAWLSIIHARGLAEPAWIADLPGSASLSRWWQENLAVPGGFVDQFSRLNSAALIADSKLVGRDIVHRAVIFAFTLIALFFLLKDGDVLAAQSRIASDRIFGPAGERLGERILLSVRGTINGLVLVGLGEGAVMTLVYLAAGVPHPVLLGLATAIAAMIPFGAAVMFAVAAALLLAQGSVAGALAVMAIGLVVVGVADHFVRPVLIGGATKLPFLWVLVGILGGVETFGLIGLFIGPAVMAALILLWRELVSGRIAPENSE